MDNVCNETSLSGPSPGRNELYCTHLHLTRREKLTERQTDRQSTSCNLERVETAASPGQKDLFSAHIPMWRLSRLQNLAISPLATILATEKQQHSGQVRGVAEKPGPRGVREDRQAGWQLRELQNAIHCFPARVDSWPEPAQKLTAHSVWPRAGCSSDITTRGL